MKPESLEDHSRPKAIRIDRSDILLLINIERELSRDAICRLGGNLDKWLNRPCTEGTAKDVGVALHPLQVAHRIADQAAVLATRERTRLKEAAIEVVFSFEQRYPTALLDLELPPPVLYLRGVLSDSPRISMVGPRHPDPWAGEVTRWFARDLAAAGLTIVSGFARGVDSLAHESAVEAGGQTLAILGCGIDVDYPRGSNRLRQSIIKNGAVLSEFAPGTTPRPHHFPIRNRIIAALGFATLVIQADLRSGSLITARLALDVGRDVFAVPGRPIDRKSRGSNALLRDGALVALSPQQILEALPIAVRDAIDQKNRATQLGQDPATEISQQGNVNRGGQDQVETKVLRAIEVEHLPPQQIAQTTNLELEDVLAAISRLEIKGRVRRCPGGSFLQSR